MGGVAASRPQPTGSMAAIRRELQKEIIVSWTRYINPTKLPPGRVLELPQPPSAESREAGGSAGRRRRLRLMVKRQKESRLGKGRQAAKMGNP